MKKAIEILKMSKVLIENRIGFDDDNLQDIADIDQALQLLKGDVSSSVWIDVNDKLPEDGQTVWCYSKNSLNIFVGSYIYVTNEGWFWASSNGCFYIEEGKIITECEVDDFDVTHWFPAPVL